MKTSEHAMQSAFFEWLALQKFDVANDGFAVPNGGARHPAVAAKLKREGVKKGIPDTLFPVARGGFIGLAIEFKSEGGNPSKEQRERITKLQKDGWCVILCWDWQAAARSVQGYAGMLRVQL